MILGYRDTRDKITLYTKGSGGLEEFKSNLQEEVLYGFIRVDRQFILINYVSDQVRFVLSADEALLPRQCSFFMRTVV
jgi:hypothetical protein